MSFLNDILEIRQRLQSLEDHVEMVAGSQMRILGVLRDMHKRLTQIEHGYDQVNQDRKINCLMFFQVVEHPDENLTGVVVDILRKEMNIHIRRCDIDRVRRIRIRNEQPGLPSQLPRPIFVKFVNYSLKSCVYQKRNCLKSIYITECLTKIRLDLVNRAKLRFGHNRVTTWDGLIIVNGVDNQKYYITNSDQLNVIPVSEYSI